MRRFDNAPSMVSRLKPHATACALRSSTRIPRLVSPSQLGARALIEGLGRRGAGGGVGWGGAGVDVSVSVSTPAA